VSGVTALHAAFTTGRLQVQPLKDPLAAATISVGLDAGESQAIALMRELGADILLLDDRRARATAQRLGLPFTGTVGILRRARDLGLVPAVAPVVEELRRRGFRISSELLDEIRREEGSKDLS
jgi:predicted nucleic acid-binding protein